MFSMSLVNMPITTWGMNALDNKVMNHGTSVNNTLRQVAGSLGTAIIIAVSTQVQNFATPEFGAAQGTMFGINAAFLVCTLLCLIGLVMTIVLVKDKPGEEEAVDEGGTRKSLLMSIMKTDVFSLSKDATVEEAMRLFVEKNISAAPIVDEAGEPVGFISDGDILKRLSPRRESFTDPIVLINSTVNDDEGYDEKLAKVMQMRASEIGAASPICVSVHSNLTDVCRVLSENHLKKVPGAGERPHRGHHQPQRHHAVLHGRLPGRSSGARRLLRRGAVRPARVRGRGLRGEVAKAPFAPNIQAAPASEGNGAACVWEAAWPASVRMGRCQVRGMRLCACLRRCGQAAVR